MTGFATSPVTDGYHKRRLAFQDSTTSSTEGETPRVKRALALLGESPATSVFQATMSTSSSALAPLNSSGETMPRFLSRGQDSLMRRSTGLEWDKKTPQISVRAIDGDTFQPIFTIDGFQLPIEKIGEGKEHIVYKFPQDQMLTLRTLDGAEVSVSTSKLALKTMKAMGRTKVQNVDSEVDAYRDLISKGKRVARLYVEPKTFVDTTQPKNGLFFIYEFVDFPVDGNAWKVGEYDKLTPEIQATLVYARNELAQMAAAGQDIVGDFRWGNVRKDSQGEHIIVDLAKSQTGKFDVKIHIAHYYLDWANGNPSILEWLLADERVPKEMAALVRSKWAEENETSVPFVVKQIV